MSQLNRDLIIGVEIGIKAISICYMNSIGQFIYKKELKSPQLLLPGAMTVELCEYFKSIKKTNKIKYLGVSLPAIFDNECRIVKKSNCLGEWLDVPFAAWLEIRLETSVILANTKDCELLGLKWSETSSSSFNSSPAAIGIAKLAHEKTYE